MNTSFRQRIEELKVAFFNSNYPKNTIENISNKILTVERNLKPPNAPESSTNVPISPSPKNQLQVDKYL